MEIKAKYIRSYSRLKIAANGVDSIRLVHPVEDRNDPILSSLGFDNVGLCVALVPVPIGRKTAANSEGWEVVRKDLPKINKTRSIYRSWEDWHGHPHSGYQNIDYKAYPRDKFPASLHEFSLIEIDGQLCFSSDRLVVSEESEGSILEVANIILECFGSLFVVDAENENFVTTKIQTLEWELLPPGDFPWDRAGLKFNLGSKKVNTDRKIAIDFRFKSVSSLNPDFIAQGAYGFTGYYIFGFESLGVYVLESIYLNNATYVFRDDWESLSKLSKSQIINGDVEYERVIHDSHWAENIGRILCL